jgi:hypothetical protein
VIIAGTVGAASDKGEDGVPERPEVRITRVTQLEMSADPARAEFDVSWIVLVPTGTTLEGFNVRLEVVYGSGSRQTARATLARGARTTRLSLLRPAPGARAQHFFASVTTRFRSVLPNPVTLTRAFDLVSGTATGSAAISAGPASGRSSGVKAEIIAARPCDGSGECYEVAWRAMPLSRQITILDFTLGIDLRYEDGAQTRAQANAGGEARTARLAVDGPGEARAKTLRATLMTNLAVSDAQTVTRSGVFN